MGPDSSFIVTTDACKTGLGYILSQPDSEGRERVISYNGRATRSYEQNYTASELELACLIQALVTYHPYLATSHFHVVTDHLSLQFIQRLKLGNSRLIRWSLLLSQYHFTIRHCPGRKLSHVDALSRRAYPPEEDNTPLHNVATETHLMAIKATANKRCVDKADRPTQTTTTTVSRGLTDSHADREPSPLPIDDVDEEVSAPSATLSTDDIPEITAPITIHNQQHDPFFAAMIHYLQSGILPADKQDARRIILQS